MNHDVTLCVNKCDYPNFENNWIGVDAITGQEWNYEVGQNILELRLLTVAYFLLY